VQKKLYWNVKKIKKDTPDAILAHCFHNLGIIMRLVNRKTESEQYFLNSIKIYDKLFSKEESHPGKANTLLHLGYTYAIYGNPKADMIFSSSLAMYKNIFGENSEKVEYIETKINTILDKQQAGESVKSILGDDD